jgi:uncharacterized membrane protein
MSEVADRYRKLLSRGEGTERIAFFSDAVFAIALTLLVLDIRVPTGLSPDELWPALLELWPEFFAFLLTFAILGINWISHHRKFRVIERFDSGLIWINLAFLALVALTPLPTSVLSEYAPDFAAVVFYAVVIAALGVLQLTMWVYAWRRGLVAASVDRPLFRYSIIGIATPPAVFLLSIVIALFDPVIAMYSWALIWPVGAVVQRIVSRRERVSRSRG